MQVRRTTPPRRNATGSGEFSPVELSSTVQEQQVVASISYAMRRQEKPGPDMGAMDLQLQPRLLQA